MLDIPYKFSWTDENVALLARMAKEGASAAETGARLGCSRNAAIGKAMRMGFKFQSDLRRRAKADPEAISAALMKRREKSPWQKLKEARKAKPEPAVVEVPISLGIGLLQLTEQTCKWPHGDPLKDDFHFCGNRSRIDSSYCDYHARLAYRPKVEIGGGATV